MAEITSPCSVRLKQPLVEDVQRRLTQILGDFINVLEAAHLRANHAYKLLNNLEKLLNVVTLKVGGGKRGDKVR